LQAAVLESTATPLIDPTELWARINQRIERVVLELERMLASAMERSSDSAPHHLERASELALQLASWFEALELTVSRDLARQLHDAMVRRSDDVGLPIALSALTEDLRDLLSLTGTAIVPADPDGPLLVVLGPTDFFTEAVLWTATTQQWRTSVQREMLPEADAVCAVAGFDMHDAERAETLMADLRARTSRPIVVCDQDLTLDVRRRIAPFATSILSAHTPTMVIGELSRLCDQWRVKPVLGILGPDTTAVGVDVQLAGVDTLALEDVAELLLQGRLGAIHGVLITGAAENELRYTVPAVVRSDPATRHVAVIVEVSDASADEVAHLLAAGADEALVATGSREVRAAVCERRVRAVVRTINEQTPLSRTTAFSRRHAMLVVERMLVAAHRRRTLVSVGVLEVDTAENAADHVVDLDGILSREFRRGDVVFQWEQNKYVIALAGIGRRTASRRFDELRQNLALAGECRIAVAEYPHDGASLDELVATAESYLVRARFDDGPLVVSADWHGTTNQGADVLVVDPDATLRALLVSLLERDEMSVVQLNDGVAAYEYLTASRDRALPRVLVMELDLMGMDGLALLRKLGENGFLSRMRVLVLTARIRESELLEALDLGANDYVTKPFAPALLLHRLRRVMSS
jgi:CheY-like chemotaxis protein